MVILGCPELISVSTRLVLAGSVFDLYPGLGFVWDNNWVRAGFMLGLECLQLGRVWFKVNKDHGVAVSWC